MLLKLPWIVSATPAQALNQSLQVKQGIWCYHDNQMPSREFRKCQQTILELLGYLKVSRAAVAS